MSRSDATPDGAGGAADASTLGDFLRSRRERLTPAEVGLPTGGRRRTPGLRREELATLAGMSVDYLVRLEQGRETRPSQQVLASLAETLRLDDDERVHLKRLAGLTAHPELCTVWQPASATSPLHGTTSMLLQRRDPTPAFVMGHTAEVAAWNEAYERLMTRTGLFDTEPPNLLRYTFLHPASRRLFRDWHTIAREQVGNLRAATTRVCGDPAMDALVGDLSINSPEFAQLWASLDVVEKRRGQMRLDHPTGGRLTVDVEALLLPESGERLLVTYLPADDPSAAVLDRLVAAAPAQQASDARRLRLVGGT
jgi:transcriptional regulator with XRE-family HTH domain